MKRETKYYIPHIDEFCVGFEYEELEYEEVIDNSSQYILPESYDNKIHPIRNRYRNRKFDITLDNDLEEIEKLLSVMKIKVKFLDADDIISLGFEFTGEAKDYQLFRRVIRAGTNPTILELSLSYCGDFPIVSLSDDESTLLDRIICLNKNELKWLLTRFKIA